MAAWPHWIIVVVFTPLLGGVLTPAVSLASRHVAKWWALAIMTVASFAAYMLAVRVSAEGPFSYYASGWKPPYGIELRFDEFSVVTAAICLIALARGALLVSLHRVAARTCPKSASPTTTRCCCSTWAG